MICDPCKKAGKGLAAWGPPLWFPEFLHEQCPAIRIGQPTLCDCQHQTESYITREASDARRNPV